MEQRIVALRITNEFIVGSGVSVGAVGSHDDVLLEMDFRNSAQWAGTTRRAIFSNALGENRKTIILTANLLAEGHTDVYLVPVPAEAKDVAGECFLTVEGYIGEGDREILRIVTGEATFRVLPSTLYNNETSSITPSEAEQLQSEIDQILGTIQEATQSARAAAASEEAAADSADSAGNDARAAEESAREAKEYSGNPPIIRNETWWTWNAEAKAYVDTGLSASGVFVGSGDMPENCYVQFDPDGDYVMGPPIIQNGTWHVWDDATGDYTDTGVAATEPGPKGDKGDKGDAGYTPVKGKDYTDGEKGDVFVPAVDGKGNLEWERKGSGETVADPAPVNLVDLVVPQLPLVVESASGDVISVSDSAERPLKGLRLFGKTTQDGTPTPEAPVELVSVGSSGTVEVTVYGKNLLDAKNPKIYHQKSSASLDEYTLTENGFKATLGEDITSSWRSFAYLIGTPEELAGKTITVSAKYKSSVQSDKHIPLLIFSQTDVEPCRDNSNIVHANGGYIGSTGSAATLKEGVVGSPSITYTVTGEEERKYIIVLMYLSYGGTFSAGDVVEYSDIQVEYGSTATAYEPYKPAQTLTVQTPNGLPGLPVASGGNYTDESGQQWVTDEIDYARGVYIQRVKQVDWTKFEARKSDDTNSAFSTSYYTDYLKTYNYKTLKCSHLSSSIDSDAGITGVFDRGVGVCAYCGKYTAGSNIIYAVFPTALVGTTKESLLSYISAQEANGTPVKLCYPSVEPIETPMSAEELAAYAALHTNYPNTTVLNDGGAGMELSYVADTKIYIDNKFAELAAAIVNNA